MQLQVMNSPFNQEQVDLLNKLIPTLTDTQRIWLSGYLTAVSGAAVLGVPAPTALQAPAVPEVSKEVTVLFGSQTGNSQRLAKQLSDKLEQQGFQVTLSAMRDFKPNGLKKVKNLLILVSTHGEGEPPDNAISFYEFLHSKRAPQLEDLQFSVLALGDTSYEFFCQTGKDFDKRLEELGGKRIAPRVDCDLDFEEPAAEWMESVLSGLSAAVSSAAASVGTAGVAGLGAPSSPAAQSVYSRSNPFRAEVIDNINLNGRGSDRETRHLVLSLEGSNLTYQPGDAVGIFPENHPQLVNDILQAMNWNGDELVAINKQGEEKPLREALALHYEITVLTKPLLEQAAGLTSNEKLKALVAAGGEELKAYTNGRDLLDLIQDFGPWDVTPGQFVSILRKLPARLYSIASSIKANPDEVHLTIRKVEYASHGRDRYGVCSAQIAERVEPGDTLPIFIQENPNFKLPENPDTPIIMIGPGTGVAPFRAFMEEREETGAEGKSWLFYGDRHFLTDFLYQIEWQRWLKDGVLTKLDVAFSRDTDEKVYVQHRMLEHSKELYAWLEEGAAVYICGDEKHMAHDVHEAFLTIIEREGGKSRAEAESYLASLQDQKRYQRDVY